MIVITGANGVFGRHVTEQLLKLVPAKDIVVSVRDTAKAEPLTQRGVAVRHGDFEQPETLPAAFAGADVVFVNATNYGTPPQQRGRQQAAAIHAAVAAGATRVVLTSWIEADTCTLPAAADYAQTERLLAQANLEGIALRLTYGLADAAARDVRWALSSGEVVAPAATARVTTAATTDLAEAAARVLLEPSPTHIYELTAPDAISWQDIATLASEIGNKEIPYRAVDSDEYRTVVAPNGWPDSAVSQLIDLYTAFRAGWANTAYKDLERVLGRTPTPSLDAVRDALAR